MAKQTDIENLLTDYRVTFQFTAPQGHIRSSAMVVSAPSADQAKALALKINEGKPHLKVTKVTVY